MVLGRWKNTKAAGGRLEVECEWLEQLAEAECNVSPRLAGLQGATRQLRECFGHIELSFGLMRGAALGHLARARNSAQHAAQCAGRGSG